MNLRPTRGNAAIRSDAAKVESGALTDAIGTRTHIDVLVPRTEVAAKMRLATRAERFDATAETRRFIEAAGFPVDASAVSALGAHEQWSYELGLRILAVAVREAANPERALASVEEWRQCDDDQLDALWSRYQDLEAELDPLGVGELSKADESTILAAARKADVDLLTSFGSRKLAQCIVAIHAPPSPDVAPVAPVAREGEP